MTPNQVARANMQPGRTGDSNDLPKKDLREMLMSKVERVAASNKENHPVQATQHAKPWLQQPDATKQQQTACTDGVPKQAALLEFYESRMGKMEQQLAQLQARTEMLESQNRSLTSLLKQMHEERIEDKKVGKSTPADTIPTLLAVKL